MPYNAIATEKFKKLGEILLTDEGLLTSEKLCHYTKKSVTCCTIILVPNFTYCLNNGTKEHVHSSAFFFFFTWKSDTYVDIYVDK